MSTSSAPQSTFTNAQNTSSVSNNSKLPSNAVPADERPNANVTVIGTQQLSNLRYEAVSTARDNEDLNHEVHMLQQALHQAKVEAHAHFEVACEFAALEKLWVQERRTLLVRLGERGGLTEEERLEVRGAPGGLFVPVGDSRGTLREFAGVAHFRACYMAEWKVSGDPIAAGAGNVMAEDDRDINLD